MRKHQKVAFKINLFGNSEITIGHSLVFSTAAIYKFCIWNDDRL